MLCMHKDRNLGSLYILVLCHTGHVVIIICYACLKIETEDSLYILVLCHTGDVVIMLFSNILEKLTEMVMDGLVTKTLSS